MVIKANLKDGFGNISCTCANQFNTRQSDPC